ncbi:unnamed protein product [Paramecium sonneborni]|uniref:Saposin B-type domain-containing protein n=1 Tax=Paramecium sonneborni TaxID=65129 RepID=A0A8S1JXT9_9CILI|nr:unnamed protein product [Paramecium sonneborni]
MKILFVFVTLLFLIEAAKKRKKTDDRRPTTVEALLYCNSCQAIVRETLKKVKTSTKESDITDALSEMCQMKNFSVYEYPPPDMKKGCEAFMSGWSEEVTEALMNRKGNDSIEDEICYKLTNSCKDIEKGQRKQNDDYVTINGKKVKMGDDGKVDINMNKPAPDDDDL